MRDCLAICAAILPADAKEGAGFRACATEMGSPSLQCNNGQVEAKGKTYAMYSVWASSLDLPAMHHENGVIHAAQFF